MVQLVPLSEEDFQIYVQNAIQRYSDDQVRAGYWHPSHALRKAEKLYRRLLPEGLNSRGQHIFSVQDEKLGQQVGIAWFAVDDRRAVPTAFVYDLIVFEEHRRKGYGALTLQALERKARNMGACRIALHVYGHNHPARALYAEAGYEVTNLHLSKEIAQNA